MRTRLLLAQQNPQQRARPRRLDARFRQHLRHRGRRQPRLLERALDGRARLSLVLVEHQRVAPQPHRFALRHDFPAASASKASSTNGGAPAGRRSGLAIPGCNGFPR